MTVESKTFKVVGKHTMHCAGCETSVEFALKVLPGLQQVKANYKTQEINLSFDPQALDMDRVRQELDWVGYQVAEVEQT